MDRYAAFSGVAVKFQKIFGCGRPGMPQPYRLFIVTIDPNGGKVNGHDKAYSIGLKENSRFTLPEIEEARKAMSWSAGTSETSERTIPPGRIRKRTIRTLLGQTEPLSAMSV